MGKNNTNKNTYEYFYVYCIENIINSKTYTGYHKGRPTDTYMGSGELIQKAIKKYGISNFKKEILWEGFCLAKEVWEIEKYYIKLGWSNGFNQYNLHEGGCGGDTSQFIDYQNPISKEKQSKALKGRHLTEETKNKISKTLSRPLTGDHLLHVQEANRIKWKNGVPERVANSFKGKHHTEESKRKIAEANRCKKGHYYNNGEIEKRFKETDIIPQNFIKGRLKRTYKKRGFWFNNGIINIQSFTCPEGFTKGRCKK